MFKFKKEVMNVKFFKWKKENAIEVRAAPVTVQVPDIKEHCNIVCGFLKDVN